MSVRKSRLSPAEQRVYYTSAQQLHEAGVDIDIPEQWVTQSRLLEVSVAPFSAIHVLRPGVTVYAVYVDICSVRNNLVLDDVAFECAWDDGIMTCSATDRRFRFDGRLEFEFSEVLNRHLEKSFCFRHAGKHLEGWLLGLGMRSVPIEYGNNRSAPLMLRFLTQWGESYTNVTAIVCRSARSREVRPRPTRLFERQSSAVASKAARETTLSASSSVKNLPSKAAQVQFPTQGGRELARQSTQFVLGGTR